MERARVVLADDHPVINEGLFRLLEHDFEVVATVRDGRELVAQVAALHPDVAVVDVGMPLLNGIEAVRKIREIAPAVKIVFLTQQTGKEYIQAALGLGASAYVLKSSAASELVAALREVLAGGSYLSTEIREKYPDGVIPQGGKALHDALTTRQREVLQLVAEGKSAKEVAHVLGISVKTVEFHKAAIMDALGLRSTAELTRYAIEHGVLPV